MLLILIGLTFCVEEDQYVVIIGMPHSAVSSTANDSIVDVTVTFEIIPQSISCTGVVVYLYVSGYDRHDEINLTYNGVCWATTLNPTIENNRVYAESPGRLIGDDQYMFSICIDELQPATRYHVRAYHYTYRGTTYSEDMYFTTKPKPTITTTDVTEITTTTAKVGGNIISTGGSCVIERGICFDTVPNPTAYVNNIYIEEATTCEARGVFVLSLMNLKPSTKYYVKAFIGVSSGTGYGDQLIEYGNEVTFNTKP